MLLGFREVADDAVAFVKPIAQIGSTYTKLEIPPHGHRDGDAVGNPLLINKGELCMKASEIELHHGLHMWRHWVLPHDQQPRLLARVGSSDMVDSFAHDTVRSLSCRVMGSQPFAVAVRVTV